MTTSMVRIGAFDFYPDGPLGCTVGYNGAHGTDIHLFQEMIACGAVRVRLNIKPDLYAATSMSASPSTWNWGFVDAVVLMANQNNIHVTLIARGFTPSNNTTFASWQENTACAPGYNQTTIPGYTKIAVALARRYSGDGNPDNAKDSSGRALQADGIEIGNEEINSMQDTSSLPYTGCRKAMRYVKLVRDTVTQLRAPSASGGGGWVPHGTFPARIGAWGIVHDQPNEIASTYGILTHPVLDATYNPTANSSSIFGFDGVLNTQMLDYANFHNYNPADGTGGLTPAAETKQIRAILDGVGNTTIPIWCTEAGWDGPCNNVTETVQANYYAANADGSGGGALQALSDAGCQHWDIFTINYWGGSLNGNYIGQAMSIATKTSATGTPPNSYVHFLAHTRIGNFMTGVDKGAWAAKPVPAGFGGSTGGGGGGGGPTPGPYTGTLTGAFAPLATTTVNLTTEGTGDWAHWGVTGTTFDHKSTGGTQISDASVVGNASKVQNPAALNSFTYSDGTPNVTETATSTGIKIVPPTTTGGAGAPHVMVVALENHSYNDATHKYVVGNPNFPHINSLLSTYSTCTHFYGISHPSLPNYLAFASGSDYGIANDSYNPASSPLSGNTLVDSLKSAGIAWKHYAENLPSTGYLGGDTGSYVQHHNPWVYFKTVRSNSAQYTNIVNYTQLATDLSGGTAPPFIFVQPNNTDNGHSGTDTQCDNFVNSLVATVQASTWYTTNSGIIILWWDESNPDADTAGIGDKGSNGAGGGHIACCVISALNSSVTFTQNVNHYGFLHALEKLYGLPYLGKSANTIDGDLTPLLGTTSGGGGGGGGPATSNLGNGFKITAPADTNPRTLKIYTDVNQGIASLAASLSDSSAPDFYDSALTDSSGGAASAGVYTLSYAAAGNGKTLNVAYTLSDNRVPGTSTANDTFTRANQSGLGTASGGGTYTLVTEAGSPAWSIASNQGKLTGAAGDTGVAILGSSTLLDCESVAIVNLSNTADSAGLVLRANSGGTTYYRASLSGSAILLYYVTGGVSTQLSIQPASIKTNANYWLRFRACKSSLYAKYWPNDGSAEPKNWSIFATDTTLSTAGKFGFRGMISAAGDSILFDTFSVVDLSATGDPSYVSLYAADLPTGVITTEGALSAVITTPAGTIDLTTEGTGDWTHWGYGSATGFDHKAGVTQQISNFTNVGGGTYTQNTGALLAWSWEDGTPDVTATASTTETTVSGVANGYSFTVPANTTNRTLNVYVAAKKAQGTLTATLSDASAAAYSDTSLNDTSTGTAKKYAITFNAASANQTLTISWTMLTDNGGSGTTTTYSTDTFVRANQSGWGLASDGVNTWTAASGAAVPSIVSNKGQITSGTSGAAVVLFSGTGVQTNGEAVVRYAATATIDSLAVILRATSSTTYYKTQLSSAGYTITKVAGGVSTDLATASVTPTLVAGTKYWLKLRLNGSNLYSRTWTDGGTEPATWNLTAIDSSIAGAGQYGVRGRINTSGDIVTIDSYTITSIPSGGTPGNIALDAASTPNTVSGPPPPPPPPPASTTLITVNATDAVLPNTWLGLGVQQDAYTQGTGAAITITSDQRNLINTRLNSTRPPIIRTCADSVSWWCPTGVVGTYDFTNALMQEWYAVFDNAQAQGFQVIVAVNSPAPFTTLSSSWCTAFADLIDYLINTLGYTCITYVSGLSEPDMN